MDAQTHRCRSTLFVPAIRWPMILKGAACEADAVCLDLEDSVPPEHKAAARDNAIRALRELDFGIRRRVVRVNGLETAETYRDLVDVVEAAGDRLDAIMLPKAERTADVLFVDRLLAQIAARHGRRDTIAIDVQIETAAGLLQSAAIAGCAPRIGALIFGPGDFAASMGMPLASIGAMDEHDAAYPGHRWHFAMQTIVVAARANGLRAIDGPFASYRDEAGLSRAAQIARALGFDGKQCIHPAQIAVVNALFTPTDAERAWAARVLAAYERARADGHGAVSLDGQMIDAANLRMARQICQDD